MPTNETHDPAKELPPMKRSTRFSLLLSLVLASAWTTNAQTATFFAAKDNATEYEVFRYQVTPTTAPVLQATITDSSLIYPLGLTLSPAGELFVVNQGTQGGSVTHFLNPTGASAFNGNISTGSEATFYGAFRGNELFVVQRVSGVLRFILDPGTGTVTPNGQIPITPTIGEFRGVVVAPWGELFVSESGGNQTIIHRFTFDQSGNAYENTTGISDVNVGGTHGMAFSPWGELFVTSPSNNTIGRFIFDAGRNAAFNGSISEGNLSVPLDLAFAPWGELFVGNCLCQPIPVAPGAYPGIARITFDAAHHPSNNGVVTTPLPISGITFVPAPPPPTTFQINIDPSNYAGDYAVNQVDVENPTNKGPVTLSLAPGAYFFDSYYHGGRFSFEVSAMGQVTNISNPTAAHANGNTLVLHNMNVTIDPRNFVGLYSLVGQSAAITGVHTYTVIPGLIFRYINYYLGDGFNFEVDAQGIVRNIEKPIAAYANGSRLTLNNTNVNVGPQQYPGSYTIYGHNYVNGAHTFTLIPGLTFRYINYYLGDGFLFDVGADGQVRNLTNPAAAQANGATLLLNNTCLRINPDGYTGAYYVSSEPFGSSGQSLHILVPSLSYELVAGSGERAPFALDAGGLATPSSLPITIVGQPHTFALDGGACDQTPPATTAQFSMAPNGAGWNKSNVTVALTATDETGGTGVRDITYSASGAQTIPSTTVSGSSISIDISNEGTTTVTFFARDNAGNIESPKTLAVKLDKHAPSISCGTADGVWHSADVSIACSATENISALVNAADASFSLGTNVAAGSETANAGTNTRTVCDLAGNCATADPVSGNKVDKKAPAITFTAPTAGTYMLNQAVTISYACTDGGSGVANCSGTTSNGGHLDTVSVGGKTFTVNASDNVGNSAAPTTVNYNVAFGVVALFDQTKASKSGSTVPIKLRLVDANGVNVSSAATIVHAVSVVQTGSNASPVLDDAGASNPDFDFRLTGDSYQFNLKTTGYGTGTYALNFTVSGDPILHSVQFQVRQ